MDGVIAYIIKSVIAAGLLYLYYHAVLRNKKFHAYNRFYLLAAMGISLVIPLVHFNWFYIKQPENLPLDGLLIVISGAPEGTVPSFTTGSLVFMFIALVSILLLSVLVARIAWIYIIKQKSQSTKMNGFTLVETAAKQAPFSFLDNLFWKHGMPMDDSNGGKILRHELTHIRQKHTWDKLFAQVAVCICWMNPFFWLMQRELAMIHEFIADEGCIQPGDTEAFALMLLQAHNQGRYLRPEHAFFHSPIKRRLIMITTSRQTPYSYARRVLPLPLAAIVLAMFSFTVGKAQADPKLHPGEEVKINKVIIEKKPSGKNGNDSLADVKIFYKKRDGSPDTLKVYNVHYSNDSLHNSPHIKLEDGTEQGVTPDYVKHWVESIVQNPPADFIYYVNGAETTRDAVKALNPAKIKTANTYKGAEAVAKYGAKAQNGVIAFTVE